MTDFVFATHAGLYLARVDFPRNRLLHSSMLEEGYHYGISVRHDSTGSSWIRAYRGGADVHHQTALECCTYRINDLEVERTNVCRLDESAGHVHQFAEGPQDSLLIANTKFNSLDLWTPRGGTISRIHFDGHQTDVNHVNSVFTSGNYLAVMLHNLRKMESQIAICRLQENQLVELARKSLPDVQCHNVGVLRDRLFYNASGSCGIVSADLQSLRRFSRLKMPEHTKGLCSDGQFIYSGMSNYAARSQRAESSAWVVQIDPATMQLKTTIQLTTPERGNRVGNINEIRIVNAEDLFASGSACDPNQLAKLVTLRQNPLPIQLRRSWIKVVSPVRDSIRKLISNRQAG